MALVGLSGCSRNGEPAQRLAILPFENLTGEPSLDWISQTGPQILAGELAGDEKSVTNLVPAIVANVAQAYGMRAQSLLHTSVTKRGDKFAFACNLEDAATHKTTSAASAEGSVLSAINQLAHKVNAKAVAFSTNNDEAVAAWGHGDYEHATMLDPDFGPAWESWAVQLLNSQRKDEAREVAHRALARPSLKPALVQQRIELLAAIVDQNVNARKAALIRIAGLSPNDPAAQLAAADAEDLARNYPAAIERYQKTLQIDPQNAGAMNGWGYAEGEAGHLDTAKTILEEYGKQFGQLVNSLDSLGEVHFMNGKFKEAADYFEKASAADPKFLNGACLLKAAYARWLANDVTAADANMRRFLDKKNKDGDVAVAWREASWLYSTGRRKEALAKLEQAPPDQRDVIDRQKSVWRGDVKPPQDLKMLKDLLDSTVVAMDGLPRTIYAAALLRAGQQDAARQQLQRWPLPETAGDPLLQSLVFPQYLELRRQLGMH